MRFFLLHAGLLAAVSAVIAVFVPLPFDRPVFYVLGSVFFGFYFSLLLWPVRTIPVVLAQLTWALLVIWLLPAGDPLLLLMAVPLITAAMLDDVYPVLTAAAGAASVLIPVFFAGVFVWELQLLFLVFTAAITALTMMYVRDRSKAHAAEQTAVELERENRRLRRSVELQEQEVREEERIRIARDIHDSVGHQLTALLMQAGVLKRSLAGEEQLQLDAERIEATAGEALEQTREAVRHMRSEELPAGVHAVLHLLRKLERESQMTVQWKAEDGFLSAPFTNDQRIAVYRFVQEGMTNAMKHGRTRSVSLHVQIRGGRQAVLTLQNRTTPETDRPAGSGLRGLSERFDALGGRLVWEHGGDVFTMEAVFPLERRERP
ncbi:histidine kinase [Alkalicoccus luteus]|uniref:histidine kinase n=1 Tax=Alkalicoccus luteus TaxID=1237094 RepID=A0A969TVC3_9BACI|nr:hypothetical protein [Alkalicoccus luteus]